MAIICFGYILAKFIFPPLAPMLSFLSRVEGAEGSYADFAGGFFSNPFENLRLNLEMFFTNIILRYFNYSIVSMNGLDPFYISIPEANELAIYFLTLIFVLISLIALWKKLSYIQKYVIIFSLVSIFSMNLVYVVFFGGAVGLLCRYNLIYLPLVIISFMIIVSTYSKEFIEEQKKIIVVLVSILLLTASGKNLSEICGTWLAALPDLKRE